MIWVIQIYGEYDRYVTLSVLLTLIDGYITDYETNSHTTDQRYIYLKKISWLPINNDETRTSFTLITMFPIHKDAAALKQRAPCFTKLVVHNSSSCVVYYISDNFLQIVSQNDVCSWPFVMTIKPIPNHIFFPAHSLCNAPNFYCCFVLSCKIIAAWLIRGPPL